VRQIKSSFETLNFSIYETRTLLFSDFDNDGDVDGTDLAAYAGDNSGISMDIFAV